MGRGQIYSATVIDRTGETVRVQSYESVEYAICHTREAIITVERGRIQELELVLDQSEAMALCHALRKAFAFHERGEDAEK